MSVFWNCGKVRRVARGWVTRITRGGLTCRVHYVATFLSRIPRSILCLSQGHSWVPKSSYKWKWTDIVNTGTFLTLLTTRSSIVNPEYQLTTLFLLPRIKFKIFSHEVSRSQILTNNKQKNLLIVPFVDLWLASEYRNSPRVRISLHN